MSRRYKYITWIVVISVFTVTAALSAYLVANNYKYEKGILVKNLNECLYNTIVNYGNYRTGLGNFPLAYQSLHIDSGAITNRGPNLVLNPDFQMGDTLFKSDYDAIPGSALGIFYNNNGWHNVQDGSSAIHGNWTGDGYLDGKNYLLLDGCTNTSSYGWQQQVPVQKNNYYQCSFMLATMAIPKQSVAAASNWHLADAALYINGVCVGHAVAPDTTMLWEKLSFYWYADTATHALLQIKDLNTGNVYNDFGLDDICFKRIELPAGAVAKTNTGIWMYPPHKALIDTTAINQLFANELRYNNLPISYNLIITGRDEVVMEEKNAEKLISYESSKYYERYYIYNSVLTTKNYFIDKLFVLRCNVYNYAWYLTEKLWQLFTGIILLHILIVLLLYFVHRYIKKSVQMKNLRYQLTDNITHELKTPVSTILAVTEGMKYYSQIENKQKLNEYIDIAIAQSQKLNGLINNALKLVDESRQDIALNKQNIALPQLLSEIAALMQQSHDCTIEVQCSEGVVVYADRFHLHNIVSTILDNSIKYCKTQPRIQITVLQKPKEINIEIKDNGIGIAPAYQKYMFDKHYRAPVPEVSTIGGHGLGLSYVKLIMQLHKGTVAVRSDGKNGTTIILTFAV